jgi:small subunit ribosomal protein S1
MSPQLPSEKNPLDAELEAALSDQSLLDVGLEPTTPKGGRRGRDDDDLRSGTIVGIDRDDVIVELGPRMQGVIDAGEFDEAPEVGQTYEFSLHGQKDGLWLLSRRKVKALAAWNDLSPGAHVEAVVSTTNSGGLECQVGPLSAFMPASQASDGHVEDLSTLIGQKFVVEVMEADPRKKRLVVSRRKVLDAEKAAMREQIAGSLHPGDDVQGKVTRIEAFGAFVDLGGVEGLVHISQLSRKRVEKVEDVVSVGDLVQAKVLEVKQGGKRIGLSIKATEPDPWDGAAMKYAPDTVVNGKVVRLMDFGAFVEIESGLEGLLHVSQILGGGQRVNRPHDVLKVGDEVSVRIQSVDPGKRRISLTRLDERGAVLGSEEAVDAAELEQIVKNTTSGGNRPLGTNLGSLFKKALEKNG